MDLPFFVVLVCLGWLLQDALMGGDGSAKDGDGK